MTNTQKTNFLRLHGETLHNNGYDVIPIAEGEKIPRIIGWNKVEVTTKILLRWQKDSTKTGIGIRCKNFPAVDLDIHDEEIVLKLIAWCFKNIGTAPIRIGRAPRCLLVFRADETFTKIKSTEYEDFLGQKHEIEILAKGQQFVAFARHKDTGNEYTWKGKSLLDIAPEELPVLTEDKAHELLAYFDGIVPKEWREKRQATKKREGIENDPLEAIKAPVDLTRDQITQALEQIEAGDYDLWVKVGMALYHQFAGSPDGYELWDEWSQAAANYDSDAVEIRWETFQHELDENPITFRSILQIIKERVKEEQKQELDELDYDEEHIQNPYGVCSLFDMQKSLAPPDWLIEGYIEKQTMGVMYAPSSSYKSFISLDLALSIATGHDWHGNKVNQGKVIYIAGEGHSGLPKRVSAWSSFHGVEFTEETPFVFVQRGPDLHDIGRALSFSAFLKDIVKDLGGVDFIVIDTMARSFGEGEENSNSDVMQFINNTTATLSKRFKSAVMIIHHTGKADKATMRGASSLRDSLDFAYRLERDATQQPFTVKFLDEKQKEYEDNRELLLRGQKVIAAEYENCILDSLVFEKTTSVGPQLTDKQKLAFDALEMHEAGIEEKLFYKQLKELNICKSTDSARKLIEKLVESEVVIKDGGTLTLF